MCIRDRYTDIPTDNLDEWFFICATYDPTIQEIESTPISYMDTHQNPYNIFDRTPPIQAFKEPYTPPPSGNYVNNENFWLNHVDTNGNIVANSGLGNKCKVEVISRSDLLRARGYRV